MSHYAEIPDKLYFKIGEVAKIARLRPHVLRYWESEFSTIRPEKSKSNQRLYRRSDVESVLAIRHLLYDRKFTIEGAKRYLREEGRQAAMPEPEPEAIAAQARRQAMEEMEEAVSRAQSESTMQIEKMLLTLKQDLVDFLGEVEADGDE